MQRLRLILVLSLGCIPISSDVSDVVSGLELARLRSCNNRVPGGPEWCQVIEGSCLEVRIGPDRDPAEGNNEERYDRRAACLLPCDGDDRCPIYHQCQKRFDDENVGGRKVCVPQGFCRGDADCVEHQYGGHLGTSKCVKGVSAICRDRRLNPCDSDGQCGSDCDRDSECTALLGEGAECYLQTCQITLDSADSSCDDEATFNGRCEHADQDALLNALDSPVGFVACDESADCGHGIACLELSRVVGGRCDRPQNAGSCQEQETEWSESSNPEDPTFCLPFVACVPKGRSSGAAGSRLSCPGLKNTSCEGRDARVLINQPPCGPDGDTCVDGSSCSAGVCFVTNANLFENYQMITIPGCQLVDEER